MVVNALVLEPERRLRVPGYIYPPLLQVQGPPRYALGRRRAAVLIAQRCPRLCRRRSTAASIRRVRVSGFLADSMPSTNQRCWLCGRPSKNGPCGRLTVHGCGEVRRHLHRPLLAVRHEVDLRPIARIDPGLGSDVAAYPEHESAAHRGDACPPGMPVDRCDDLRPLRPESLDDLDRDLDARGRLPARFDRCRETHQQSPWLLRRLPVLIPATVAKRTRGPVTLDGASVHGCQRQEQDASPRLRSPHRDCSREPLGTAQTKEHVEG